MERACRWGDNQPTAATRAQESRAPVFRPATFPPLRVSGRSGGAPGRRSSPFRVIASDCPRVSLGRVSAVRLSERLIAAMMLCLILCFIIRFMLLHFCLLSFCFFGSFAN